jgi:CRP-like cAMP-binding protein
MAIDWEELSAAHPNLASIPQGLRAGAGQLVFAVGEILARRSGRPTNMLYVLDGEIRLVRYTATGDKLILQRGRHGFIAEASMDAKAYHCDIEAFEAGHLLTFPIPLFRRTLDDDPGFRRSWARLMAVEIRRLRAQNERLHLHKAADRVLHFLESEGTDGLITLTQSRKAWAAELGLSHEALYRTLRRMEHDGLLKASDKRIQSTRPSADR